MKFRAMPLSFIFFLIYLFYCQCFNISQVTRGKWENTEEQLSNQVSTTWPVFKTAGSGFMLKLSWFFYGFGNLNCKENVK